MIQVTQDGLTVRRIDSSDRDDVANMLFSYAPKRSGATIESMRAYFDRYLAANEYSDPFFAGAPITANDGFETLLTGRIGADLVNLMLLQVTSRMAVPKMILTIPGLEGQGNFGRLIDATEALVFDRFELECVRYKTRAAYNPYEARMAPKNATVLKTFSNGDKVQEYTREQFDTTIKQQRATTPVFIG